MYGDDMPQIGSESAVPYSDWHVGLYTFVIMTSWGWYLSAEKCRIWCHMLDDTEIRVVCECSNNQWHVPDIKYGIYECSTKSKACKGINLPFICFLVNTFHQFTCPANTVNIQNIWFAYLQYRIIITLIIVIFKITIITTTPMIYSLQPCHCFLSI
jgi:hypothetical protein